MSEPRPWHRLFSLSWTDFCDGSCLVVDTERDLSHKQQFIDLVLTRQGDGALPQPLPDGFEDLATHNIVTFKSHQEALDGWALCELIGHYVNTRKQVSPSMQELLPASDFRLYAVCVRFPQNLSREMTLEQLREGVYEITFGALRIRIIVVQELPFAEGNSFLHLFSTSVDQVQYGRQHYRPRSRDISTLFLDLLTTVTEDPEMSETLKEYARTRLKELGERPIIRELIRGLPAEIRLDGMSAEERLEGIPTEKRLEGIPTEKRLDGLSPEQLRIVVEQAQRKLRANDPIDPPE